MIDEKKKIAEIWRVIFNQYFLSLLRQKKWVADKWTNGPMDTWMDKRTNRPMGQQTDPLIEILGCI